MLGYYVDRLQPNNLIHHQKVLKYKCQFNATVHCRGKINTYKTMCLFFHQYFITLLNIEFNV